MIHLPEPAVIVQRPIGSSARCPLANGLSVREHVAQGWFNEAGTLAELGRTADAIAAFCGLITHFGGDEDPEVQEQVAMALVNLGKQFGDAGRRDDELAAYATVVERFGDNTAPYARDESEPPEVRVRLLNSGTDATNDSDKKSRDLLGMSRFAR